MANKSRRTAALLAGVGLAAGALTGAQPAAAENSGVPGRSTEVSTRQADGDFGESLIYSGAFAMALAGTGLAIVGWRRRQW
jgi:hypothetical protein